MQRDLLLISIRKPRQDDKYGRCASHGYMELDPDKATVIAYTDNTGQKPKNFEPGSLAEKQWEYKATRARRHQQMDLEELLNGI